MPDKLNIRLTLDAHPVALTIPFEQELIYREAGVLLNRRYQFYRQRMPQASAEELWVYVALEMAVHVKSDVHAKSLRPVEEKITELNKKIESCL